MQNVCREEKTLDLLCICFLKFGFSSETFLPPWLVVSCTEYSFRIHVKMLDKTQITKKTYSEKE